MNNLKFHDMLMKYEYYKNIIINDYINQGIYPNKSQIETTINRIDLSLPILQDYKVHEGSKFNTKQYNDTLNQIYTDMLFLYELTYDITISRFNNLKNTLQCKLTNLKNKTDDIYRRSQIERNSTSLGNTIFYKSNIIPSKDNNAYIIDIDKPVSLHPCSKIACFLNANGVVTDDVVFIFLRVEADDNGEPIEKKYYSPVYNNNQYSFVVPGSLVSNTYKFELSDNMALGPSAKILIDGSNYNYNNKYHIFSGNNMMIVKDKETGQCNTEKIPTGDAYVVQKDSFVEFYILDGNSVSFTFNQQPKSTNFKLNNSALAINESIKHIFMECKAGTIFNISLDRGTIYAYNNTSIYNNNDSLTVQNPHGIKDYIIYEYSRDENTVNYNVKVRINNADNQNMIVDNITIKELLAF